MGAARGGEGLRAQVDSARMDAIRVGALLDDKKFDLRLSLVAGRQGLSRRISSNRIQKPGLVLAGFTEYLHKERVQVFQGAVIRRQGSGLRETFTVRKVSYGVGVERTFPIHSPTIAKIELVTRGDVRRAKLYYLRDRVGKAARLKPGSRTRFEALTNRPYVEEAETEDVLSGEPEDEELEETAVEAQAEETADAEAPAEAEAAAEEAQPAAE